MGHEVTLTSDSNQRDALIGMLLRLSDQVARRLRGEGYVGRTVALKLRDHRFHTRIRQRALASHTQDHMSVYTVVRELFEDLWDGGPVRLLGVSVSGLEPAAGSGQTELFDTDRRARELREALDRVRDKLGEASVVPAGTLTHRGKLGHVPFGTVGPTRLPKE
jgi:hypothetical protein